MCRRRAIPDVYAATLVDEGASRGRHEAQPPLSFQPRGIYPLPRALALAALKSSSGALCLGRQNRTYCHSTDKDFPPDKRTTLHAHVSPQIPSTLHHRPLSESHISLSIMSPPRSHRRPYVPPMAAPGNPFVTADCSFVRPAAQATYDYAHGDGPVARCRGAAPRHASLDTSCVYLGPEIWGSMMSNP